MGDNYNDLTMLNANIAKYYGGPANSVSTLQDVLRSTDGFISDASYGHGVIEALKHIFGNTP